MTYDKKSFMQISRIAPTASQYISDSYTEISGSKTSVSKKTISSDLYYKFCFYASTDQTDEESVFLHVKLQRSNDNFSSNIVDVSGCMLNYSTDVSTSSDKLHKLINPFFIVQNTDNDSLRLVARSYSSSNRTQIHLNSEFDGSNSLTNYFNPSLTVMEI